MAEARQTIHAPGMSGKLFVKMSEQCVFLFEFDSLANFLPLNISLSYLFLKNHLASNLNSLGLSLIGKRCGDNKTKYGLIIL